MDLFFLFEFPAQLGSPPKNKNRPYNVYPGQVVEPQSFA